MAMKPKAAKDPMPWTKGKKTPIVGKTMKKGK